MGNTTKKISAASLTPWALLALVFFVVFSLSVSADSHECDAELQVVKEVWDGENWVDSTTTCIGEDVRFRATVMNTGCCSLTNIIIIDVLSDSMSYNGGLNVWIDDIEQVPAPSAIDLGGGAFGWFLPGVVIDPMQTIVIEFNAMTIAMGTDTNTIIASGSCETYPSEGAMARDIATVMVTEPSIEVMKSIWDPATEMWVDSLMARVGDIVTVNVTIHTDGCCPMIDIMGSDMLPLGLMYVDDSAMFTMGYGTISTMPDMVSWTVDGMLDPCESVSLIYQASVGTEGLDPMIPYPEYVNDVLITGICLNDGLPYSAEDNATIIIPPSVEVEKMVWDPALSEWVDELETVIGEDVRFKCKIHNDGSVPIDTVIVTDTLSRSLEYNNALSVSIRGVPVSGDLDPDTAPGGTIIWTLTGIDLMPCETVVIEFNATIVTCGIDTNTIWVEASPSGISETVEAMDTASIIVKPIPWEVKEMVAGELEAMAGGDWKIQRALYYIERSLNENYWEDADTLDNYYGRYVFIYEYLAIRYLDDEDHGELIAMLACADRVLAMNAIEDAQALPEPTSTHLKDMYDASMEKAEQKLCEGDDALEGGDARTAILMYKSAWEYAQQAVNYAS